jgi:hypothetical protein
MEATMMFTLVPEVSNNNPRRMNCITIDHVERSTNCGKKAKKNSATFGFSTLVVNPCLKTSRSRKLFDLRA